MVLDQKRATVDPSEFHVSLAITPESPTTHQRFVAVVPGMLDENQARKTTYRASIVKLHTRLMPAVRRFLPLVNGSLRPAPEEDRKANQRNNYYQREPNEKANNNALLGDSDAQRS
jgi:hypothetical protein